MAENDWMRRLREAGVDFTETARARAEEVLQEFSRHEGSRAEGSSEDPGRPRPEGLLGDPLRAGGTLLGLLRQEIRSQLVELGLVGSDDLRELRARVNALDARLSSLEAEMAAARRDARSGDKHAGKAAGTKAAAKKPKKADGAKGAVKEPGKSPAGPSGQS